VGLGRAGGGLGIQRIGLATPAPRRPVGAVDLDHDLTLGAQEASQPSPEAAGALDPPGLELAETLGPANSSA
jgi:hypothetical protein